MKKAVIVLTIMVWCMLSCFEVSAENGEISEEELYTQQYETVGADTLINDLPMEIREQLEEIGITSPTWQELNGLSFSDIVKTVTDTVQEQAVTPFNVLIKIMGIIVLISLTDALENAMTSQTLKTVMNGVSVMTVSVVLIRPLSEVIGYAVNIINVSADFMLAYIPIMVTVMLSSGQAIQGAGNYAIVTGAGTVISQISKNMLVPLLHTFLGMSVVSGISQRINLGGFCELIYKIIRWVLTFVMSMFTAILTMQSIIGVSGDTAGVRATRFAISSFVPLVGGALSEAYQTVRSCMGMLKSGIGVFSIIATALMYMPCIVSCLLWLTAVNISVAMAGVFNAGQIGNLLRSIATVISTLTAILLCCMMIFIISSTVMLMVGQF